VALAVNEWRETNSLVHFGLATTCTYTRDAYVEASRRGDKGSGSGRRGRQPRRDHAGIRGFESAVILGAELFGKQNGG